MPWLRADVMTHAEAFPGGQEDAVESDRRYAVNV
jgi:hypothetical protein